MISGVSAGATSGSGSAMYAAMSGGGIKSTSNAASGGQAASSSVVRLSSPTAIRQTSADGLGLYGPGTSSAAAMAQRLRQAADDNLHPKTGNAQNPMGDVMLMLLIAQAKGYLSSAHGTI